VYIYYMALYMDRDRTIELICEDCGAEFDIQHEMGLHYIPQYCIFCSKEIYHNEDRLIEIEELLR